MNLNRASMATVPTDDSVLLNFRRNSRRKSSLTKDNWLKLDSSNGEEEDVKYEEVTYAPDGGWGWVIVFASYMNNFVLDGVASSYGVLTQEMAEKSGETVGEFEYQLCESIMLGMTLLVGPFVSALTEYFSFRTLSIFGSVISCAGFLVSWLGSPEIPEFWSLFFGFGVLGGIGFGFMYTTSIVIVGLYFDKNRPLATGIAVSGGAVGSMVMPIAIGQITSHWGWQGALQALAAACLLSAVFGALYKPIPTRLKKVANIEEKDGKEGNKLLSEFGQMWELLCSPTYLILALSGSCTVFGFFVPSALLLDRAAESPFNATEEEELWLTTAVGGSNVLGRLFSGFLANSERATYSLRITNIALTFGGIATILSVYATKYNQLLIYTIIYGYMIGVFASLRSIIVMDFFGEERFNVGFGLSLSFMGLACLFGNSTAGLLKKITGDYDLSFLLTGGIFILSAVMCYPLRWIHQKEKERKSGPRFFSSFFRRGEVNHIQEADADITPLTDLVEIFEAGEL